MGMYAIVECGGKQYRVSDGDVVRVEKLDAAVGSVINLDKVLLLSSDKIYVGTPLVEGAVVSCKVLDQDKEKKVIVYHYKAKKNIRKRYGHRQPFTSLLVDSISHDGQVFKTEKKVEAPKPVETETAVTTEAKPVKKAVSNTKLGEEKPVKKAAPAKKAETGTAKPVAKKTTTSAKKAETAATAEEKPVKKTTARAKKSTESEG